MGGEEGEIVAAQIGFEPDRRREAAIDRQHRTLGNAGEGDGFRRPVEHQHAVLEACARHGCKRQIAAVLADQAEIERDHHRLFVRLARRRRKALLAFERVGLGVGIEAAGNRHLRRAGLAVPAHELRQVARTRIGEALDELLDGGGLAVVALEIEVHAGAEFLRADQRLHHAHHFGAFLVHGRRVEIIDLLICFRPNRMREGAGVLDELRRAQAAHIADAFDRARAHVGGKFLVAENREAFLQAKLKPVAAGDAVAGPVVEIFVRDDGFDAGEIAVGRGFGRRQHVFVVEDVEALVLHRAHVEVGNGDDHENIEIVFAAERLSRPSASRA